MRFFYKLSIQNKFSVISLFISLVLISLISVGLIVHEQLSLKRNLSADLLTLADIIGANASTALMFRDARATESTLATLKAKSNILQAHIFDEEGNSFARYIYNTEPDAEALIEAHAEQDHLEGVYFAESHPTMLSTEIQDRAFFEHDHIDVFKHIYVREQLVGTVYIQADLKEMQQRLWRYSQMILLIACVSLIFALTLGRYLQCMITKPMLHLMHMMDQVSEHKNYSLRATKQTDDEVGRLIIGFNNMLDTIEANNQEIQILNQQLQAENQRMSAELEVTQRLQKMVLPKESELQQVEDLDISCFMQPADEVGGDYYDVLYHNGQLKIGIGDVTGHGLESGVVMLMVQMAVRTLLTSQIDNPHVFLNILNETLFHNVQRMDSDKNLTLSLLDYQDGKVRISGQHEDVLLISQEGHVECLDTFDLGFMVGLTQDISAFIGEINLNLEPGEGIVLYTDGITEARNPDDQMYGIQRLCESITTHWQASSAKQIEAGILQDFRDFVGNRKLLDDVTLLVIRRAAS